MKTMKSIYRIFVTVGAVLIVVLGWGLIANSDIYQRYEAKKDLCSYLSATNRSFTLKQVFFSPKYWIVQSGTNESLTLKQVITGEEPAIATFEVPVKYDLLKVPEYLRLLVDHRDEDDIAGRGEQIQDCNRATNGNCLLVWNTTFDPPGQHQLKVCLHCPGTRMTSYRVFLGPTLPFYSSNSVQFESFYSSFDSNGALLHAKVAKTNLTYSIELKSPVGAHIKTITGSTSNGIIDEHWDLTDDHGNRYTNDSFNSDFHVTLPDGTSETNMAPKAHTQKLQ